MIKWNRIGLCLGVIACFVIGGWAGYVLKGNWTRWGDVFLLRKLGLVAHGGGDGEPNRLATIGRSYIAGHRFFEVDLSWTSDQVLVGIHDWGDSWRAIARCASCTIPTHSEFMAVTDGEGMDLHGLCRWRDLHPDARIITDVKSELVKSLEMIKGRCGVSGFIPQVHNEYGYQAAVRLGYDSVILTLYRSKRHPTYLYEEWSSSRSLIGITFPAERFSDYDLDRLGAGGRCLLVHTINSHSEWNSMAGHGMCAVYTDRMIPGAKGGGVVGSRTPL